MTVALMLMSVTAIAQVTTSGINGLVMASGEEAIGATITAKHIPSGAVYRGVTNISGRYAIDGIFPKNDKTTQRLVCPISCFMS